MNQIHEGFLHQIANSLFKQYGQGISNLTIVFPNRRAGLYFTAYLSRLIQTPTFSPEIITIQDLFSKLSPLRIEDDLQLIFRLFRSYKHLVSNSESFDEFYSWGEILLHDFDQVDKYLVNAELLFTNITELKEIDAYFEDWNAERREQIKQFWRSIQTGGQLNDKMEFSRFWQVLNPLYFTFKNELFRENIAFEGMQYRDAVENLNVSVSTYLKNKFFVIAGFNALNSCEKLLFKTLKECNQVSFYWDYDNYYLNDTFQEAGLFMRENLVQFPQNHIPYCTDNYKKRKIVKVISTSSQVGQIQCVADEIAKNKCNSLTFDDTAIVLCDESLLLPLLSAVPAEIETVNITMGLPFRQTPVYDLIIQLITLQKRCRIINGIAHFHHKNVSDILNNQLIRTLYNSDIKSITDKIIQKNLLYLSVAEIGNCEVFKKIFSVPTELFNLPGYFLEVLFELFRIWENESLNDVSGNYLEQLYLSYISVNKLDNLLFSKGFEILGNRDFLTKETFYRLMIQYLGALTISFDGEPLSGLQIMGILETRTLDFQKLFILSVNEGIMPRSNTAGSFIPYHLRKGVGLPTIEEQSAMYAYYFYRLLQRADEVTLIYNSGPIGLKTGEKSRFLHQLILESGLELEISSIDNFIDPLIIKPIVIEKNDEILMKISRMNENGKRFSPTALDMFLQCSLSYYFKYIAHFDTDDDISEEIDSKIFGKIFHTVMESIYKPHLGKIIDHNSLIVVIENEQLIQNLLRKAFDTHFFRTNSDLSAIHIAGKNSLAFEVLKKMVIQTLQFDLKKVPFRILGLELDISAMVPIKNGTEKILVGGYIDRIDGVEDGIEIVDYKTGSTNLIVTSISDLFDSQIIKRNKAAFQTLIYCYLWDKLEVNSQKIFPSIYELKKIFQIQNSRLNLKNSTSAFLNFQDVKLEFTPLLIKLIEEILDPKLPFKQTEVKEKCQYCSFASLCNR